ncbi:MAG: hypothetical protein PHR35_13535, partial [Kiritimatiellae bacterium]|nr:hypothetical protein [Kiritimatiellia bacterium]
MRRLLMAAGAACVLFGSGCEWSGSGDEDSWDDSYSWVNFSGTYRLYNVVDPEDESTSNQIQVTGEGQGVTGATDTYSGTLAHRPVVAGSVTINIGGTTFTDDGTGSLSGGQGGSINWGTGAWNAKTSGTPPVSGVGITATYKYLVSSTVVAGGSPITSLTVNQQGNLINIRDNNGAAYSGRVTGASVPEDGRSAASNIRMVFYASSGKSKINGTLAGDWSGTGEGTSGTLANRQLEGTY